MSAAMDCTDHDYDPHVLQVHDDKQEIIEGGSPAEGHALAAPVDDFPPVRACLFDLDGTLLDSEDHYVEIANSILAHYDKKPLSWDVISVMQAGPHTHHVMHQWAGLIDQDKQPNPSSPIDVASYEQELAARLKMRYPLVKPLAGAIALIQKLATATNGHDGGKVYLAIASSSSTTSFNLKTAHLEHDLFRYFPAGLRILGDNENIVQGRGKPCPDIYLLALKAINDHLPLGVRQILPIECLVFEDSVPGVEASRRAGMRCVWVPQQGLAEEFLGREDTVLAGIVGIGRTRRDVPVMIGIIGDGWAEQLLTLAETDLQKYGFDLRDTSHDANIQGAYNAASEIVQDSQDLSEMPRTPKTIQIHKCLELL